MARQTRHLRALTKLQIERDFLPPGVYLSDSRIRAELCLPAALDFDVCRSLPADCCPPVNILRTVASFCYVVWQATILVDRELDACIYFLQACLALMHFRDDSIVHGLLHDFQVIFREISFT